MDHPTSQDSLDALHEDGSGNSIDDVPHQRNEAAADAFIKDGFQFVDPHFVDVERLALLILFAAATLAAVITFLFMWLSGVDAILQTWAAVGMAAVCAMLLGCAVVWPGIEYRHLHWRLSEMGLEIRRGVFWKHRTAVPWARAQHADVSQGPLQRIFEIGSLTIHTAGTSNSSVTIDGLNHDQALRLRDEIIGQRKAHDVV